MTYAVGGTKPRGRSDHASVRIGASEVWTVGGTCNGRRVGDVCVFDTIKMEWASCDDTKCVMKPGEVDVAHLTRWPARSGHAAVAFGSKILVIGGLHREGRSGGGASARFGSWRRRPGSGAGSRSRATRRAPGLGTPPRWWRVRGTKPEGCGVWRRGSTRSTPRRRSGSWT